MPYRVGDYVGLLAAKTVIAPSGSTAYRTEPHVLTGRFLLTVYPEVDANEAELGPGEPFVEGSDSLDHDIEVHCTPGTPGKVIAVIAPGIYRIRCKVTLPQ